ncbi:MAG: 4-hydroxy-tetrahydrodipicolinate reductase [Fusobacteriaceae bacterium]
MKIAVFGYGAMGKIVADTINSRENLELVGTVDQIVGEAKFKKLEDMKEKPDVIIDFSHFSKLSEVIDYGLKENIAVFVATTGHSEEQLKYLESASKKIPILKATNTSLGVNLLNELMKYIVPVLQDWDIELIEKHHNKKIDSPSGTAKTLLEKINEALSEKRDYKYGRQGNSKREKKEIGVHAVRGGTIVGEHSVIFAGEDEIVELKHEAHSKKIFANGAVTGAIWLAQKKAGFYKMSDVLF